MSTSQTVWYTSQISENRAGDKDVVDGFKRNAVGV